MATRKVGNCPPETMKEDCDLLRSGTLSQRIASERFGIPRKSLARYLKKIEERV